MKMMNDNEVAGARYQARGCLRRGRTQSETLRELREDFGPRVELEIIVRHVARMEELRSIGEEHMRLCHGDGSSCLDGCDRAADPSRLALYQSLG